MESVGLDEAAKRWAMAERLEMSLMGGSHTFVAGERGRHYQREEGRGTTVSFSLLNPRWREDVTRYVIKMIILLLRLCKDGKNVGAMATEGVTFASMANG